MTPAGWVEARWAMLAKSTQGPWQENTDPEDVRRQFDRSLGRDVVGDGHRIASDIEDREDLDLIIAAVNEQAAVVRLVEAVSAFLDGYGCAPGSHAAARSADLREALAALVGEEETSG